jgi:hypothetical protein
LYLFALRREPPHGVAPVTKTAKVAASASTAVPPERRPILLVLVAVALTLFSAIMSTVGVHLLTILQAQGVALATAVALGALVGPSQVSARIV